MKKQITLLIYAVLTAFLLLSAVSCTERGSTGQTGSGVSPAEAGQPSPGNAGTSAKSDSDTPATVTEPAGESGTVPADTKSPETEKPETSPSGDATDTAEYTGPLTTEVTSAATEPSVPPQTSSVNTGEVTTPPDTGSTVTQPAETGPAATDEVTKPLVTEPAVTEPAVTSSKSTEITLPWDLDPSYTTAVTTSRGPIELPEIP